MVGWYWARGNGVTPLKPAYGAFYKLKPLPRPNAYTSSDPYLPLEVCLTYIIQGKQHIIRHTLIVIGTIL